MGMLSIAASPRRHTDPNPAVFSLLGFFLALLGLLSPTQGSACCPLPGIALAMVGTASDISSIPPLYVAAQHFWVPTSPPHAQRDLFLKTRKLLASPMLVLARSRAAARLWLPLLE